MCKCNTLPGPRPNRCPGSLMRWYIGLVGGYGLGWVLSLVVVSYFSAFDVKEFDTMTPSWTNKTEKDMFLFSREVQMRYFKLLFCIFCSVFWDRKSKILYPPVSSQTNKKTNLKSDSSCKNITIQTFIVNLNSMRHTDSVTPLSSSSSE